MPEYLFEYFDETEPEFIEVDTSTLPVPSWEPPASHIITLDDLEDLDDELEAYDYTREPRPRDRYHEKSSITLRDYQEQAVNNTFDEWLKGNWSTLVVMATATGKTFVMAGIAKRYQGVFGTRPDGKPRRGLFLAHRDYLLGQLANAMAAMGLESAIEQAEKKAMAGLFDDPEIVIASVQSMQRKRLEQWPRDYFDYIITDDQRSHTRISIGISDPMPPTGCS
jgi:superfamily II DNA or RNA helicase